MSATELLVALQALQRDPSPSAAAWSTVVRYASENFIIAGKPHLEDVRQETLLTAATRLEQMRATNAAGARAWFARIWERRQIDARRAQGRERGHWSPEDVEALPAPIAGARLAHDPFDVIQCVLARVERHVEALPGTVRSRRREHARAALLAVVFGLDARELADAMNAHEVRPETLGRWVSSGRRVVLRALDRWADAEGDDERVAAIVEVLRELMLERRADAGMPRAMRREAA